MNSDLNFKQIGAKIQYYRTEQKMTQEQLAERAGTTQKYLSRIETGCHRLSLDMIVALANALQVSVDALIADYSDSNNESTLKTIMDDIRGMSATQLEMLRENIKTIKKFNN